MKHFLFRILLTGHYGHFNVLTIVISFSLLLSGRGTTGIEVEAGVLLGLVGTAWDVGCALAAAAVVGAVLAGSIIPFGQLGKRCGELSGLLQVMAESNLVSRLYRQILSPYGVLHPYGLFAVMTTQRREVIVEGSNDGSVWLEYELPYKPNGHKRSRNLPWAILPPLHLPRLDWRLWFCPLQSAPQEWVLNLQQRLLKGDAAVLSLFHVVPFDHPPKYVRLDLYQFEFNSPDERKKSGSDWLRKKIGPYASATSAMHK